MKVKELITKLQEQDPEMDVRCRDIDVTIPYFYKINNVGYQQIEKDIVRVIIEVF